MVLASVGCAAIPVMRPLTLPVLEDELSGEGPIEVQVVVLSERGGPEGACNGCRSDSGVQGVKWIGLIRACTMACSCAAVTDFSLPAAATPLGILPAPAFGVKPHVSKPSEAAEMAVKTTSLV